MQLSKKKKHFCDYFFFQKSNLILNILKKKMTLKADVFLNLLTPKNVVR